MASENPEPNLESLSDRDLLLLVHSELRGVKRRLARVEGNQTMMIGWARDISLSRSIDHVVAQIDAHLEHQSNGDAG
jgi:hypothetical protein